MFPFARYAFFTLARDAGFAALAGLTMMVAASGYEAAIAFKVGATVALAFCLLLLCRSYFLTDERFRRSEAWRGLHPDERPAGDHGREVARRQMEELMLQFAKAAAGISGILFSSALISTVGTIAQAGN